MAAGRKRAFDKQEALDQAMKRILGERLLRH